MAVSQTRVEGAVPDLAGGGLARRRLLFAAGAAISLSAVSWARFEVGGLLFQPALIPAGLLLLLGGGTVYARIPRAIRGSFTAFIGLFLFTILAGGGQFLGAMAKVLMAWVCVVSVAGSVDDEDDARAGALGFVIGMALVSLWALATGGTNEEAGINPLAGISNANGFSIYALPAVLLGGYYTLAATTPFRSRITFAAGAGIATVAILSTPNRSGFLGLAVVVVLLLSRGRRARDVIVLVLLASTLYFGFLTFGDTSAMDLEFGRGQERDDSDFEKRRTLVEESLSIGTSHPLGVGLANVPARLGERMYERGLIHTPFIDAHNLIGDIAAGGGLILLGTFVFAMAAFWLRPAEYAALGPPSPEEKDARNLLRITVVLFLVRGMFSGAVITTPAFPVALGLTIGLTVARRPRPSSRRDVQAGGDDGAPTRRPVRRGARFDHPRRLVAHDPWAAPPLPAPTSR